MSRPPYRFAARSQLGFNLIELMIGVAVGLVVSSAVVVFIASALSANTHTIKASRLQSELRAIVEIIARDVRRARSVQDSIANVGQGSANVAATWRPINVATAGCIVYGYQGAVGGDFRAIQRDASSGIGVVKISTGATAAATGACDLSGTTVSSPIVDVTALTFTRVGVSRIDLTIVGRLANDNQNIQRQYSTSVFIRSAP